MQQIKIAKLSKWNFLCFNEGIVIASNCCLLYVFSVIMFQLKPLCKAALSRIFKVISNNFAILCWHHISLHKTEKGLKKIMHSSGGYIYHLNVNGHSSPSCLNGGQHHSMENLIDFCRTYLWVLIYCSTTSGTFFLSLIRASISMCWGNMQP